MNCTCFQSSYPFRGLWRLAAALCLFFAMGLIIAISARADAVDDVAAGMLKFRESMTVHQKVDDAFLSQLFTRYPKLMAVYDGVQYTAYPTGSILKITYKNTDKNLADMPQVNTPEQLEHLLTATLLSARANVMVCVENGKHNPKYDMNEMVRKIKQNTYIAYMGYKSIAHTTYYDDASPHIVLDIQFQYDYPEQELTKMKRTLEQEVHNVAQALFTQDMPPYARQKAVHDYIVGHTTYDTAENISPMSHTAYGCLVGGVAVCDGYSYAANLLLEAGGIWSTVVSGRGRSEDHAWNIVKIEEEYYHMDATWDDPVSHDGKEVIRYDYYNITDAKMAQDHLWNSADYPACNGKEYCYENVAMRMKNLSKDRGQTIGSAFTSLFERFANKEQENAKASEQNKPEVEHAAEAPRETAAMPSKELQGLLGTNTVLMLCIVFIAGLAVIFSFIMMAHLFRKVK